MRSWWIAGACTALLMSSAAAQTAQPDPAKPAETPAPASTPASTMAGTQPPVPVTAPEKTAEVDTDQKVPDTEAIAECREDLRSLEPLLTVRDGTRTLMPREDLQTIAQGLLTLAKYGEEDACEEATEALRDLIEDRREAWDDAAEMRRIQEAQPITQVVPEIRATHLIGLPVVNRQGESLGSVYDVVLLDQEKRLVLIEHSGFLGIGEDFTPLRWDWIALTESRDKVVVDVSEDALDDSPKWQEDANAEQFSAMDAWWNARNQKK